MTDGARLMLFCAKRVAALTMLVAVAWDGMQM